MPPVARRVHAQLGFNVVFVTSLHSRRTRQRLVVAVPFASHARSTRRQGEPFCRSPWNEIPIRRGLGSALHDLSSFTVRPVVLESMSTAVVGQVVHLPVVGSWRYLSHESVLLVVPSAGRTVFRPLLHPPSQPCRNIGPLECYCCPLHERTTVVEEPDAAADDDDDMSSSTRSSAAGSSPP